MSWNFVYQFVRMTKRAKQSDVVHSSLVVRISEIKGQFFCICIYCMYIKWRIWWEKQKNITPKILKHFNQLIIEWNYFIIPDPHLLSTMKTFIIFLVLAIIASSITTSSADCSDSKYYKETCNALTQDCHTHCTTLEGAIYGQCMYKVPTFTCICCS